MNILVSILYFVVIAVVLLAAIYVLKKFVFSKVRVNKFIPLSIAVIGFVYQWFFKPEDPFINIGLTIGVVLFFVWFWDINQTGGPKAKEKKINIKPKAKPNRVKKLEK